MQLLVISLLLLPLFLDLGIALVAKPGDKVIREWRDLSKKLGWTVFDKYGRPFDPAVNLNYCARRTVRVPLEPNVGDYTERLNAELRKMRTLDPPGGTLLLDAGKYTITQPLKVYSYTCLIGAGIDRTNITLRDNAPRFNQSGMVRSRFSERVTFANFTVDGNMDRQLTLDVHGEGYGRFGLYTELSNYLYVFRVRTVKNLGYGFDPHGAKVAWSYYLLIEDCESNFNGLDGFTLDQTVYVALKNSIAIGNHRHGVNIVTGTRYARVQRTVSRDNGFISEVGCGMTAQNNQNYSTRHIRFDKNVVLRARKAGLCLNDVRNVGVERNDFQPVDSRSFCVHITASRNVRMRADDCEPARRDRQLRSIPYTTYKYLDVNNIGVTRTSRRTPNVVGSSSLL